MRTHELKSYTWDGIHTAGSYRRERLVETESIVAPHKEADLVQIYSDRSVFYGASEHYMIVLCNSKYVQYISIDRRLIWFSNAAGIFTSRSPEQQLRSGVFQRDWCLVRLSNTKQLYLYYHAVAVLSRWDTVKLSVY